MDTAGRGPHGLTAANKRGMMANEYRITEGRAGGTVQNAGGQTVGRILLESERAQRPFTATLSDGTHAGYHATVDAGAIAIVTLLEER